MSGDNLLISIELFHSHSIFAFPLSPLFFTPYLVIAVSAPTALLVAKTVILFLPHVHGIARERIEFVLRGIEQAEGGGAGAGGVVLEKNQ